MNVINTGYNNSHQAAFRAERPNGLPDYLLLIIRSPARIILDGKTQYINGNQVILLNKKTPHYIYGQNEPFVNDWVQFDMNDEELAFVKSKGIPFDTIMEFTDVQMLSMLVSLLHAERWSDYPNAVNSNALLMQLLILKMADYISTPKYSFTTLEDRLRSLRKNIYTSPRSEWSIDAIAQSLHISNSYLHAKYKKLFGTTVKSDVIASRLEASKFLLSNTKSPIAAVAEQCGYDNELNFMYIFKKKTGLTPSQYRAQSYQSTK